MPILHRGTDLNLSKRSYDYRPLKKLAVLFYCYLDPFEYQDENIIKGCTSVF